MTGEVTRMKGRRSVDVECSDPHGDLMQRLDSIERLVTEHVRQGAEFSAIMKVMLTRIGDPELITVKEAAVLEQLLNGKGSVASVRRKIDDGTYTLMKRAGEKAGRIAVAEIHAVHRREYLAIQTWRNAHGRQKN